MVNKFIIIIIILLNKVVYKLSTEGIAAYRRIELDEKSGDRSTLCVIVATWRQWIVIRRPGLD